jgi:hypothetical protein
MLFPNPYDGILFCIFQPSLGDQRGHEGLKPQVQTPILPKKKNIYIYIKEEADLLKPRSLKGSVEHSFLLPSPLPHIST